jgi:hypothetical protein
MGQEIPSGFGIRSSDFFRISEFGFRVFPLSFLAFFVLPVSRMTLVSSQAAAVGKASHGMRKPLIISLLSGWQHRRRAWGRRLLSIPQSACPFLQLLPRGNGKGRASGFSVLVAPGEGQHTAHANAPVKLVPQ